MTRVTLTVSIVFFWASGLAAADQAPPPPSAAEVKACIKQMDSGDKWRFEWKVLQVGAPRHPLNNLEALAIFGGEGRRNDYGYPVHVVYSLRGLAEIDAVYWLIRDAGGHWQIPAVCVLR